jgi:dTDP-4-dehydrorhamnose 3,5-epimerase-like enzyme
VYYLYATPPGQERGFHSHRRLEQLAVCVSGAVTITVDDGRDRRHVRLDRPDLGLHIGPMIWREMRNFTDGAVLMVLASMPYDEGDYMRSYEDFVAAVRAERRP